MSTIESELISVKYEWTLQPNKFNRIGQALLRSEVFYDSKKFTAWFIKLYPSGKSRKAKKMNIFLVLDKSSRLHEVEDVAFSFSILDSDQNLHHVQWSSKSFSITSDRCFGFVGFVSHQTLKENHKLLKPNGKFTLLCQIIFAKPNWSNALHRLILSPIVSGTLDFTWHINNFAEFEKLPSGTQICSPSFLDSSKNTNWSLMYEVDSNSGSKLIQLNFNYGFAPVNITLKLSVSNPPQTLNFYDQTLHLVKMKPKSSQIFLLEEEDSASKLKGPICIALSGSFVEIPKKKRKKNKTKNNNQIVSMQICLDLNFLENWIQQIIDALNAL